MENNTTTKTIYFPICLIRGFEDEPHETARKIQTYCFNQLADKYGKETATKRIGFTNFAKYEIEPFSPVTYFNLDFIKSVANGFEIDYELTSVFLYVCAVRSILGKKQFCKTNWELIASRCNGQRKPTNSGKNGIARRFTLHSRWKDTITQLAYDLYKIGYYSKHGVRGFFVYTGLKQEEFIAIAEPILKKEIKSTKITESNKSAANNLSDETISVMMKKACDELNITIDHDIIQYARKNGIWGGNFKVMKQELAKFIHGKSQYISLF